MKIREVSSRSIVGADVHDNLRSAAVQLAGNEVGALLIYDSQGPVGIFSERDLAQAVADGAELEDTRVRDYMTRAPVRIKSSAPMDEGVAKMSDLGVRHLVVVEDGEVVGVVSARDILKALNAGHTLSLTGSGAQS